MASGRSLSNQGPSLSPIGNSRREMSRSPSRSARSGASSGGVLERFTVEELLEEVRKRKDGSKATSAHERAPTSTEEMLYRWRAGGSLAYTRDRPLGWPRNANQPVGANQIPETSQTSLTVAMQSQRVVSKRLSKEVCHGSNAGEKKAE